MRRREELAHLIGKNACLRIFGDISSAYKVLPSTRRWENSAGGVGARARGPKHAIGGGDASYLEDGRIRNVLRSGSSCPLGTHFYLRQQDR